MKKTTILFFIIFHLSLGYSQSGYNQTKNWVFGAGCGISFCSGAPTNFSSLTHISQAEGTASVSDSACGLLFYTDGVTVWDSTGSPMPNGNGTLLGNNTTTQSATVVPDPGNKNRYYLFTDNASDNNGQNGIYNGFAYSIIDMSLPGNGTAIAPLGDVVASSLNSVLFKSADSMPFYSTERVAAVKICETTNDYWIITHESSGNTSVASDTFIFYRLTASGVTYDHKQGIGSNMYGDCIGYLHFSQDGTKAVSSLSEAPFGADLFNFDNQTGLFSNWIHLEIPATTTSVYTYGAEFSPQSNFVYLTNMVGTSGVSAIFQYNLNAGNVSAINSSVITLDSINIDSLSGYNGIPANTVEYYAALALGPDGRIYTAIEDQNFLSVINYPDSPGLACGFQRQGFQLASGMRCKLGLPNDLITNTSQKCLTGIAEIFNDSDISIYPNPSSGIYTISNTPNMDKLCITDALGRGLLNMDIKGQIKTYIDLSKEEKGIYFFQFITPSGSFVKKVVLD